MADYLPDLDPKEYRWQTDHQGTLTPQITPERTLYALPNILKLDRCIFIESLSSFSSSQATAPGAATSDEGAVR